MITLPKTPFEDYNRLSIMLQNKTFAEIKNYFSIQPSKDMHIIRSVDGEYSYFDLNYCSICVTIQEDKYNGKGIIVGNVEYYET
jgi:hypothetical protein